MPLQEIKRLREIWGGFRPARVLITANNYMLFDHLKRPLTAETLSKRLGTDKRATEILLDCLTSMKLLKKTGNRYQNTRIASRFLVSDSPCYQGNIIRHADTLWKNWSGLDEVLRTGRSLRAHRDQRSFILGMHDIARLKAKEVVKALNLRGVRRVLDLGGGPGTYAMEFAKRGLDVTLFDYPETIKIATELTAQEGLRINFLEGDFLIDSIGTGYDLIFISQVLHAYSEKENLEVLKKCRAALTDKGRIVIHEFFLSPDRTYPLNSALFSVNMLVNTDAGRAYSVSEIKGWLKRTGFRRLSHRLIDDTVLISGEVNSLRRR